MNATFSTSVTSGYTDLTSFTFTDTTSPLSAVVFRSWNFDDSTYTNGISATHIFSTPGTYDVVLTVTANTGESFNTSHSILVQNYITEGIKFAEVPPPSVQGKVQQYPFRVSLSAVDFNDHYVDLYAQFSKSAPSRPPTRWSGLQPQWRFLDTNFKEISSIKTIDTIVYHPDTTSAIGITGYADFYYVDDIPTFDPIILWATLRRENANSKIKTATPYYIDATEPASLFITEDLARSIHPIKWANSSIPHLITVRGILQDTYPVIYNFPSTSTPYASAGTLHLVLSGCNSYEFDISTPVFSRHDVSGFDTGGYIRNKVSTTCNTFNPETSSTGTTVISGSLDIVYGGSPRSTPFAWVPNPMNALIHKIRFDPTPDNINQLLTVAISSIPTEIKSIPVDVLTVDDAGALDTTGYAGVYGVAVDPHFNAWITDTELDRIYKFDAKGTLLQTIELDTILTGIDLAPSSICLDSGLNIYVTLADSFKVVKFDSAGTFLGLIEIPSTTVAALSAGVIFEDTYNDTPYPTPATHETIIPTIVETDSQDNVWIGYSGMDFTALIQYNKNGVYQRHIMLDEGHQPVDLIVDAINNDSIWVSLAHPDYGNGGSVKKYSSLGVQLSSINVAEPYYLAQDVKGNIWVTYEFNKVGHIFTSNGSMETITVSATNPGLSAASDWFNIADNLEETSLDGIACDAYNRVWVLDSLDNRVHVLDGDTYEDVTFKMPDANLEFYNDNSNLTNYSEYNIENSSIQAIGDWTGFKWHQKYLKYREGVTFTKTLTGTSAPFYLFEFKNLNDIRRFNESFDIMNYIKNLPMPEVISQNTIFFDDFLGKAIGGLETEDQSIGRLAYERIANFTGNHSDVDICGITQLYSLANKLDVSLDNYDLSYPPELRRLMDIISISHARLWGARSKNENKFADSFSCCADCEPDNRGAPLDFYTSSVSAGTKIVAKSQFSPRYQAISIIPHNSQAVYPLSAIDIPELTAPLDKNYTFFKFVHKFDNKQVEGVIHWDDPYTTLKETNSSIDAWYGNIETYEDQGIIEQMLNYALYKGLDLID